MHEPHSHSLKLSPLAFALAGVMALVVLWVYWTTLDEIVWRWWVDPQYSHGVLVPVFAGVLLWLRRGRLAGKRLQPSAWGVALLLVAASVRLAGAYFHFGYLDQISLLPCLAGLILLAGGGAALAWSWQAVAFLAFMIPLPHTLSQMLSGPMQLFATKVSTYLLQTFGLPALSEGVLIRINDIPLLKVVEACSGLSMLLSFFALSTGVALYIGKPLWEKCFVVASAIPIALLSNILRITATGIVCYLIGGTLGDQFHDIAGLLMPIVGAGLLGLELWILQTLLLERPTGKLLCQMPLQRAPASPIGLYRSNTSSRRERAAAKSAPQTAAEPVQEETAAQS